MAAPPVRASAGALPICAGVSLPEVAACLARAGLYIGNNSGLMHLAAATGTPTLGLFGPTSAEEYAPAGRCTLVASAPSHRMEDLSVEDALAAATRLIARAEAA